MHMLPKYLNLLFLTILLSACATITQQSVPTQLAWDKRKAALEQIKHWQLNGKIAIQTPREAGSATLNWQETGDDFAITLSGPLGTPGLKLFGQRQGKSTLELANGQKFTATSPEKLLLQQAGWPIPVSNLYYWVRGLPVSNIPYQASFDEYHRITKLTQQGIEINFLNYMNTGSVELPNKIFITQPSLKVKIMIYQWHIST